MILGYFILRKRYSLIEYLAAFLLCLGLIAFTLTDASSQPSFHIQGIVLVSISVLFESIQANVQHKVLYSQGTSTTEMLFYSNLISAVILIVLMLFTGDLMNAVSYCLQHPEAQAMVMLEAFLQCMGGEFYIQMIKHFGVVVAISMTTFRRFLSLMISFLLFPKVFVWQYAIGVLLIFSGLGVIIYQRKQEEEQQRAPTPLPLSSSSKNDESTSDQSNHESKEFVVNVDGESSDSKKFLPNLAFKALRPAPFIHSIFNAKALCPRIQ